jgi:uroporphyrinogen decarboxylase
MDEITSRQRILAAIQRQPLDRVPTDIWATPEIWDKLRARFGTDEEVRRALHIDGFASLRPRYIGPPLPDYPEGAEQSAREFYGIWNMRLKWMNFATGRYLEQANHPLAEAQTIDDLEAYRWPSADWFDYSQMRAEAERLHGEQAIMCGYMAPFYLHNLLRGLATSLMDPLDDAEFTHHLVQRISDFEYERHRRMFEACDGLIDVAQVTDDLGSQAGPLISLAAYREFYAPHHKRFIDLCHEFGIKVFHHDDGSMRAFLPDLVEMGIDILNPIQWVCPGMEMTALKRDFGDKLCFHGGIENQHILPLGSPEVVRAEVRHCIDALASDHTGYILAPCHNIQAITPIENVIALYDEAGRYGRF